MPIRSMTYGTLPTREEFDAAWNALPDRQGNPVVAGAMRQFGMRYSFTNDPRVGTCELTCSELWRELESARDEWSASDYVDTGDEDSSRAQVESDYQRKEAAGQWCSQVLGVLGFEWV